MRAVREFLSALEAVADPNPDRKPPKVISPTDPCSAWTAKANKRVQFGYGLNYLIDIENAVIIDVEPTPARTYDEVESTKTMLDRAERRFNLKPKRLAADTAYGSGRFCGWLVDRGVPRTSQFAMPASVPTVLFHGVTFAGTSGGAFTFAPTIRCCILTAGCTMATCFDNAPPSSIAISVRSKCNVAPICLRDRSRVTFMRMLAIWPAA